MMTSLPSMINSILCVKEWDIKINSVKKDVGSFHRYLEFYVKGMR